MPYNTVYKSHPFPLCCHLKELLPKKMYADTHPSNPTNPIYMHRKCISWPLTWIVPFPVSKSINILPRGTHFWDLRPLLGPLCMDGEEGCCKITHWEPLPDTQISEDFEAAALTRHKRQGPIRYGHFDEEFKYLLDLYIYNIYRCCHHFF